MSQVELAYHLTCITNSSVRVQEDITVTNTCHKLNDLALSCRSLIILHVNAIVFGPSLLIYHNLLTLSIYLSIVRDFMKENIIMIITS